MSGLEDREEAKAAGKSLQGELERAFEDLKRLREDEKLNAKDDEATTTGPQWPGAGKNSVMGPQCEQTPGQPYVFYHRVSNADTKASGLRMSACLAAMDNCRTDMFTTCDMTVEAYRKVNDPFIEVAIELYPAIRKLGEESSRRGLLHRTSRGALLSWLRLEAVFGWPGFPMKTEETTIYHVGKDKSSGQKEPICTARFVEAFTDKERALNGDEWEKASDRFWASVKENHSVSRLSSRRLESYYDPAGEPFMPTHFKKVTWMMSHCYEDLWEILYHGKTPELLWDVNKLAGGDFAELVAEEVDPQAIAMNLPKPMEVANEYNVLCFLDVDTRKAVYVLAPKGSTTKTNEVVLSVCALYRWQGLPQNGKTLHREDFQVISGASQISLINFANGQEYKATKSVDLSKLAS